VYGTGDMSKNENRIFMKAVEEHERDWGNESYPNRPGLIDILNAPVVVFWDSAEKDVAEMITLHQDMAEIKKHFMRLLISKYKSAPKRRVSQMFENQQRMVVKDIDIVFGMAQEEE
jgi:hypothetical protein